MNTKLTPGHARPASGRTDQAGHRRGWRQAAATAAAAALTVSGALVAVGLGAGAASGASPTVISAVDFEDGTTGTWSQSGGPTLAVVDSPDGAADGKVLSITRKADYEGLQSPAGLFTPGTTYSFSMRARLAAGGPASSDIRFVAKPTYNWIGNTTINATGWTTVAGTWTATAAADADPATLQIYLGTSDLADASAYTLLVDDIEITGPPAPSGAAETVIDTDFEDGTAQGWTLRDTATADASVAVVDGGADGTAHALQVSGRDNQGDGPQYSVAGKLEAGTTYHFDGWLRFADGQEPGDLTLSARTVNGTAENFSNLLAITGVGNDWTHVEGDVTLPSFDGAAEIYVETKWASGDPGNTSTFLLDEVTVTKPGAPVVQDLTPLKDTVSFPVGVAVDSRETTGSAADLLLRHFNQLTAENHMKPDAWYDADRNFRRNPEATTLLDFAQKNHLRIYGHVLVWHGQTPDWFFQHDDGTPLTSSDADKAILRQRMKDHIDNVAANIAGDYGDFGSATNPLVAFDVVNEVISDSNDPGDGLRHSPWYNVLGEEFVSDAFQYADDAFNHQHAAAGTTRPVKLFINDYNTDQSAKQDRYFALVQRLLAADVPVDGVGHQFHCSITTPIASLDQTLTRFATLPVVQAATELDSGVGSTVTEANLIQQGHWYRDAFDVFRQHASDLFSVTVWGLNDTRSWRSTEAPTLFDGALQAKYAYFGAAGDDAGVPALINSANVFGGDVPLDASAAGSVAWNNLPSQPLTNSAGTFVPRWTGDHLTLLVKVASDTSDGVEVTYGGQTYGITKSGTASGGASGVVFDDSGDGWRAVLHVPHSGISVGDSGKLDVRALKGSDVVGAWNSAGATGTVVFLEDLSTVDVTEAVGPAPVIDGVVDDVWNSATVVHTGKTVEGAADGASADVRTLWKGDDTLYALLEVTDPVIDLSSADPWNQDSVELFLDLGNTKKGGYGANDAQLRISADNVASFGTGDAAAQAARLTSATARTATGYVVEVAVKLKGQSGGQNDVPLGGPDTFQGVDFQVNDGRDGSRYAVHTWADPTGAGYQSTARWGVAHLVAAPPAAPVPPLTAAQLTNQVRGGVAVPGQVKAGGQATVKVADAPSKAVAVWFYGAEPTLTSGTTSAKGDITVGVPAGTPAGKYKVGVFDLAGKLLGWNEARVS
jgi:endo-1,4-beta-xylanase